MSEKYIAGVDIGGTKIAVAIAAKDGDIVAQNSFPTNPTRDPHEVVDHLLALIASMVNENQTPVAGVGIVCCGPLDLERGLVMTPPNLPLWREFPLHHIVETRLGTPVVLENDANAAAVGEHLYGAGRGLDDMVYLTISTGIGCGIIAGGRLLHRSGEGGHITVQTGSDRLCGCGAYGCMEALCSGTAIALRVRQLLNTSRPGIPRSGLSENGQVTAKMVVEALREGDELALEVWQEMIGFMAEGVGNLITVLAPQAVVFGGSVAFGAGELLLNPLMDELRKRVRLVPLEKVQIRLAGLGADSALHGALALAAQTLTPAELAG